MIREIPGRHATGTTFEANELPAAATGPAPDWPAQWITKKRALSVAEELSGLKCRGFVEHGRCTIEVHAKKERLLFTAKTWWSALGGVLVYFKKSDG